MLVHELRAKLAEYPDHHTVWADPGEMPTDPEDLSLGSVELVEPDANCSVRLTLGWR